MPSLRHFALCLCFFSLPLFTACRQTLNQRCQVDSDCVPGLRCVLPAGGNVQEGGTCQPEVLFDGGQDATADSDVADSATTDSAVTDSAIADTAASD